MSIGLLISVFRFNAYFPVPAIGHRSRRDFSGIW